MEPSLELHTRRGLVPLGFVHAGAELYLVARERAALWPVDLLRSGIAELRLPGGTQERGPVRLVVDPGEQQSILDRFRKKYGDAGFARWYANPARVLEVRVGGGPVPAAAGAYPGWIEAEFDNIADDYDRHITGNRVNRLLRERSLATLRTTFGDARLLLDLGCGSGMETIPLLEDGHELVAVDISTRMLEVVRRKAAARGLSERLRCVRLRAGELDRPPEQLRDLRPDGAYSTYGALNCEPDLGPVARGLALLLPPRASFVAGVYNRWCLFETAAYALLGQPSRAAARWRNPVAVGSSRFCVDVWAYSAPEFERRFAPEFSVRRREGVPVTIPPSDLTEYAERFSRHFEQWARADAWLGHRWPWSRLGDHFLETLVRTEAPVRPADGTA